MKDFLEKYPVLIDIPVAWGEMDAFRHVNNIVYFRYFETCRMKYFEAMGYEKYIEKGIGPILGSTSCKYKIPLTYPDIVTVGARVIKMSDDRFWMSYHVVSHQHKKLAAEGEGVLVSYDYNENRKINLPDELRENILQLENNNVEIIHK